MPVFAKRILGVLLAVLGLALSVVGAWFVVNLGTTGTATFTASVDSDQPVVLGPDVLNRVDVPVTVKVTSSDDAEVFLGLTTPHDAGVALEDGGHELITGVEVRDWLLTSEERPGDEAPDVAALDLWGEQASGTGSAEIVVHPDGTPTTVVAAAAGDAEIATVEASWPKQTWFYQAAVVVVAGLLLLLVGVMTALQAGQQRTPRSVPTGDEPAGDEPGATRVSRHDLRRARGGRR